MKRIFLGALLALCVALGSGASARADLFEPKNGRTFVVRGVDGKMLEKLQPGVDSYVRRDLTGVRLGRAVPRFGDELAFYDTTGQLIGTARRDAHSPLTLRLKTVATIHSPSGATLGVITAD
jgi:hypothetical protein